MTHLMLPKTLPVKDRKIRDLENIYFLRDLKQWQYFSHKNNATYFKSAN